MLQPVCCFKKQENEKVSRVLQREKEIHETILTIFSAAYFEEHHVQGTDYRLSLKWQKCIKVKRGGTLIKLNKTGPSLYYITSTVR